MMVRYPLPRLRESRGCIINISSGAGRIVQPDFTLYGGAKPALIHMTRLMASELAPNIRVNAIALYLASPAARWITGKILEVDGGMETSNMPFR